MTSRFPRGNLPTLQPGLGSATPAVLLAGDLLPTGAVPSAKADRGMLGARGGASALESATAHSVQTLMNICVTAISGTPVSTWQLAASLAVPSNGIRSP